MTDPTAHPRRDDRMLWMGLLMALAYWLFEALIHSVAFEQESLAHHLIPADPHELWTRSLVSALFLAFGWAAHTVLARVHRAREEQRQLQARLEEAMMRALSGFLPICAHCKKIRLDDANPNEPGSWHTVESYLHRRTDLEITHSICPACERELYWKNLETPAGDYDI